MIEQVVPACGCHVALTGGLLYKTGERKDLDIVLYRIRQVERIDMELLWPALASIGVNRISGFGWVWKAEFLGKSVDILFPEEEHGEYQPKPV